MVEIRYNVQQTNTVERSRKRAIILVFLGFFASRGNLTGGKDKDILLLRTAVQTDSRQQAALKP